MKTLKELTWEHHKEAERQKFVKVLMSGKIIPEIYAIYLANQHKTYDVLEAMAMEKMVVVSDIDGCKEVVEEAKCGIIFKSKNLTTKNLPFFD